MLSYFSRPRLARKRYRHHGNFCMMSALSSPVRLPTPVELESSNLLSSIMLRFVTGKIRDHALRGVSNFYVNVLKVPFVLVVVPAFVHPGLHIPCPFRKRWNVRHAVRVRSDDASPGRSHKPSSRCLSTHRVEYEKKRVYFVRGAGVALPFSRAHTGSESRPFGVQAAYRSEH